MKVLFYIFVIIAVIGTSCSNTESPISDNKLFETNHTFGDSYFRYSYINNNVDQIIFHSDSTEYVYLKVNYLNNSDSKIKSVNYNQVTQTYLQHDTLIYSSQNLTQIIKITTENGKITRRDTTNFLYDLENRLIQARNKIREVDFLEYEGKTFKRVKYYMYSQLQSDILLKYDNMISPFKDLGYLNLVFFNNNILERLEYLTDNNIVELSVNESRSIAYTKTYHYNYSYSSKDRPLTVTTIMEDYNEFRIEEYYRYK